MPAASAALQVCPVLLVWSPRGSAMYELVLTLTPLGKRGPVAARARIYLAGHPVTPECRSLDEIEWSIDELRRELERIRGEARRGFDSLQSGGPRRDRTNRPTGSRNARR